MFDRLAKVGVLVVAVGTDGGINCSANVRDHGDINIAIKRLHRGLMKSCYESLFLKKKRISSLPVPEHRQHRWRS